MKKAGLLIIALLLLSIHIYSLEMIFRDNECFENIDFLCRAGVLDINPNNLPIRSDELVSSIERALSRQINGETRISLSEADLLNSLMNRFNGGSFVIRERVDISEDYSTFQEGDTNNILFNNKLYFNIPMPQGLLSFDVRTLFPYDNIDSSVTRMKRWKNTGSDNYNTFIGFYSQKAWFLFGRVIPAWGQGLKDDIFISRKVLPLDGFLSEISFGKILFSFYAANKTEYKSSNKRSTDNVYLSAHKLSAELPYKTYIAFKEMIIYRSNLPQMYYLNPILPYYIVQHNSHSDDNIFWSFEFVNRFLRGVFLSGELFVDDFQYEKESFYIPNKIGMLANISYIPENFSRLTVYGEYCRINTYANTHEYPQLAYMYYTIPITYMDGTDMDFSFLGAKYRASNSLILDLNASFKRRGEGELTHSWESERPETEPDFPSGSVTSTLSSQIGINYRFLKICELEFSVEGAFHSFYDDEADSSISQKKINIKGILSVTL